MAFDDRWAGFLDELLANDAIERPLLLATAAGVRLNALRVVALAFNDNWDLAEAQAPSVPVEPPEWTPRLDALMGELAAACDERHNADDDDTLHDRLCQLEEWAGRVRAASDEYTQAWPARRRQPAQRQGARRQGSLARRLRPRRSPRAHRAGPHRLRPAAHRGRAGRRDAAGGRAAPVHARCRRRAPQGRSSSSSTICWCWPARCCGARHAACRPRRPPRSLPPPADRRVPGHRPHPDRAGGADRGDRPERRATRRGTTSRSVPATCSSSAIPSSRSTGSAGPTSPCSCGRPIASVATGGQLTLTTNYRSTRAIIAVVNHVFGRLIEPQGHGGVRSQPAYEALVAVRDDAPVGPAVSILGRRQHGEDAPEAEPTGDTPDAGAPAPRAPRLYAEDVRRLESADVAATIRRALDEGWLVDRSPDANRHDWQPARAGDVTILVPTRLSLPALEDALSDAGISYRAESASLVYASRLVRDLLLTLRAIDDPSDELSVVAALRSPMFGCGDDDLFRFRHDHGGRFDHSAGLPDTVPRRRPRGVRARLPAAGCTTSGRGARPARWPTPWSATDGCSSWARPTVDRATCGGGCASCVDQARAWTDATNGSPAPVPRVGAPADRRGQPGRRGRAARDRRRRRAHHDRARRQGAPVPDHHRRPACRPGPSAAAWGPRWCGRRRARRSSGSATRCARRRSRRGCRSTSRCRTTSASASSMSPVPGRGPPGRFACTGPYAAPCPTTTPASPAPSCSRWPLINCSTASPIGAPRPQGVAAEAGDAPDVAAQPPPAAGGPPPAGRLPPFDDWRRHPRRGARRQRPAPDAWRPPHSPTTAVPTSLDDPGPAQATARPRPAAVAEGPLRHRDRAEPCTACCRRSTSPAEAASPRRLRPRPRPRA